MNAAFVILTSALLGNHPAAAPCNNCSAPAPACASCDSGHSSFGHRLRGQLTGLFSCNTCSAPAPAPCPAQACDSCGHGGTWGNNGGLFGRFRGMFSHRSSSDCCSAPAAACDSCGAAAPAGAAPPAADAPAGDAPKKMPDAPKGDAPKGDAPKGDAPKDDAPKGDKATRLQETPEPLAIPSVNPVINSRPSVIVAPATLRNPF